MKKITDLLKKRFDLPNLKETLYILRSFSRKEKLVFLVLFLVFTTSFLIGLRQINNLFLTEIPAPGGTLKEGITGTPRFINPLLAISDADHAMTSLIYAGLLRSDNKNGLIKDLAESYEVSEDGLSYTFTLKPDLKWQDNEPITSDDIIFTIQQAKNPAIKSPKRATWEGVDVEKIDDRTIRFLLERPFPPFLGNTTMGILPKHIWKEVLPEQMILSEFNIKPIGAGPYKIKRLNRNSSGIINSYELIPNKEFSLKIPYIKNLILRFYPSEIELIEAYQGGYVDSITAVSPQLAEEIKKDDATVKTLSLPRVFGVFFNQNNAEIFSQKEIRLALNYATDKERVVREVLQGFGTKLDYPIPPGTFGAISEESERTFSIEKAREILEENGWKYVEEPKNEEADEDEEPEMIWQKKIAKKGTLRLEFSISTSDAPDLKQSAELLKSMWEELGVKVHLRVFEVGDLNYNVIRPRKYEALLFGTIVGHDPDPFAFWHSSQMNDPGYNVAMYANITVDKLLQDARATSDTKIRKEKYEEFQKIVADDAAAIFLYSPRFIYIAPNFLQGLDETNNITTPSERFAQIYNWYTKTQKIWKIFAK